MTTIRHAVAKGLHADSFESQPLGSTLKNLAHGSACAVAIALLGFSSVAMAQQAPAQANASSGPVTLEEVTVTGSRIKRTTDFTTPTPTTVIDSATMDSLGIVNVGQALSMSPANISTFTPAATGNANFFTGSYIGDLRGLNPFFGSRTLTLINTRRVVNTDQGDSFDLNFIPQILVQRIDNVTGGASAAYGSGAVGGVINVFLDTKLEGGKINADYYQTAYSDGKDTHIGAAYGHGLFDNRVHFVIGGEYEDSKAIGCQEARSWCANDKGIYQTAPLPGQEYGIGTGLRVNQISMTAQVSNPGATTNGQGLQFTSDGQSLMPYGFGTIPYPGAAVTNSVPGGSGNPIYQFTNLSAPVDRGVLTGTLTAAITDNINMSADVDWGKVETLNYNQGITDTNSAISWQNPYVNSSLDSTLFPGFANCATPGTAGCTFSMNKDWTSQIGSFTRFITTVKRFSVGFDGKFGQSSWTWDGYFTYGLTNREQIVNDQRTVLSYSMAIDSVMGPNGQPECRVTRDGGNAAAAAFDFFGANGTFPGYFLAAVLGGPAGAAQASALAAGCVPLNPFGNQPMSQAAHDYAFGNLDERLRYNQTVGALNVSGDIWSGIGAGPWAAAAGAEWRQEVGHNDEAACPAGTENDPALCHYKIDDFLIQYGEPFGGIVTVQEGYGELDLPLLKDKPGAQFLKVNLAARESRYDNKALYGIDVVNGVQPEFTHNLFTWKAQAEWDPVNWMRIRGSQSRDARAPNFRELYYGQIFTPGGIFGYCDVGRLGFGGDPCRWNLEGNVALSPETSDTTTFGFVFTPKDAIPGLEFSADWVHIKIKNAIQQANIALVWDGCRINHDPVACAAMTFNNLYYLASAPTTPVAAGTPGAVTGAAAWQIGSNNALTTTANSFNGAFYEIKAIDFSANYALDMGKLGSLNTRLLSTWTGMQVFQNNPTAAVQNILGQTGSGNLFLNDYQPTAKWRGNAIVTWSKGPIALTPSMTYVGHGIQDYTYPAYLPYNHVPSYFLFAFNATYSVENLTALKGFQVYAQVNNLFNRQPPQTFGGGAFGTSNGVGGTNPVFFDTFGLAWRLGIRATF